jgi:hypothetical protein
MRKLIVSNLVSSDGYAEAKDRNLDVQFDYFHEDYNGDQNFDFHRTEQLRAADTLLPSGRTTFLDNKTYWSILRTSSEGRICATRLARSNSGRAEISCRSWRGSGNILACYQVGWMKSYVERSFAIFYRSA